MAIDTALFHQICIYILYGCMVVLTFVVLERLAYYALLATRSRSIEKALRVSKLKGAIFAPSFQGNDVLSRSIGDYIRAQTTRNLSRAQVEDLSGELFIHVNDRVGARLWMLDTIVTAAPLLGLLGTILGIMDTFNALSAGGISDPAAVSRGIAAALLATAIGILTALYGLLGHNLLHRQSDVLTERFKRFLLAATMGDMRRSELPAE